MNIIKRTSDYILKMIEHKRWNLKLKKYPELKRVYSVFEKHPQSNWIIGKNDALNLYKLVLETKPKKVLELGTGIGAGTAVIALALKHLGGGVIISIEQSPKCVEIAQELIEPSLKQRIQIVTAKPVIFKIEKLSKWRYFSGYDWIPEGDFFNFVVIDGPGRWMQNGELITLDNGDLIRILPYLAEGCKVYIDGRRATVEIIKRYLSTYFTILEDNDKYTLLYYKKGNKRIKSLNDLQVVDRMLERSSEYLENNVVINTNK